MQKSEKKTCFEILIMAAGFSSRMEGEDKLLKKKNNKSILAHVVEQAVKSEVGFVRVILGYNLEKRERELNRLPVYRYFCSNYSEGLAASIRCGLNQINNNVDGVIIALSDMPLVTSDDYRLLRDNYDPSNKKEICQSKSEKGLIGHPILFGKRFFNNLKSLSGDRGGKAIINNNKEFVTEVFTYGDGATVDIDTIDDWINWKELN